MNYRCALLATLLLSPGLLLQSAEPPVQVGGRWLQARGTYVKSDGCDCLKPGIALGLGLGSWLSGRWGWELEVLQNRLQDRTGAQQAQERQLLGSVLFRLNSGGNWVPYLRTGLGGARVDSPYSLGPEPSTRLAYHAGVGLQAWFGPRSFASLEFRSVSIQTQAVRVEAQGVVGLGFRWGGGTAAPKGLAVLPAALVAEEGAVSPEPGSTAVAAEGTVAATGGTPVGPVAGSATGASAGANAAAAGAGSAQPLPTLAAQGLSAKAQLPLAPAAGAGAPVAKPNLIILSEAVLHFANGQADLPPAGAESVRRVAHDLQAYYPSDCVLVVTGYTSSPGKAANNRTLSRRRAQAVAKELQAAGIAAKRMTVVGRGRHQPAARNGTSAGQAANRRVEIRILAPLAKPLKGKRVVVK